MVWTSNPYTYVGSNSFTDIEPELSDKNLTELELDQIVRVFLCESYRSK